MLTCACTTTADVSAATLEYSPGSAVAIFVTYLQHKLLQRMHETEGAYNLCQLTEVQLQIGLGLQDYKYGSVHGTMLYVHAFEPGFEHSNQSVEHLFQKPSSLLLSAL